MAEAVESASGVELVGVSSTCVSGHLHGFLLADWREEISLADVQRVVELRDRLLEGDYRGAIHMAEAGLQLPTNACREAVGAALQAHSHLRTPIALVIFGSGFGASAIRSLGTAVFTLRAGRPTRVVSNIADAAAWMAECSGGEVPAALLTSACAAVRRARPLDG